MRRVVYMLAGVILIAFPLVLGAKSDDAGIWVKVLKKEGEMWINEKPSDKGATAKLGDLIRTGKASSAVIKLKDRTVLLLRPHTKVKVIVTGGIRKRPIIAVLAGKILVVFSTGRHELTTPTAVAGVRGTSLYVMVESEKQSYFCVCFGTVEFKAKADSSVKKKITAVHHSAIRIKEDGGRAFIEQAEMADHSDEEVKYLKGLLKEEF